MSNETAARASPRPHRDGRWRRLSRGRRTHCPPCRRNARAIEARSRHSSNRGHRRFDPSPDGTADEMERKKAREERRAAFASRTDHGVVEMEKSSRARAWPLRARVMPVARRQTAVRLAPVSTRSTACTLLPRLAVPPPWSPGRRRCRWFRAFLFRRRHALVILVVGSERHRRVRHAFPELGDDRYVLLAVTPRQVFDSCRLEIRRHERLVRGQRPGCRALGQRRQHGGDALGRLLMRLHRHVPRAILVMQQQHAQLRRRSQKDFPASPRALLISSRGSHSPPPAREPRRRPRSPPVRPPPRRGASRNTPLDPTPPPPSAACPPFPPRARPLPGHPPTPPSRRSPRRYPAARPSAWASTRWRAPDGDAPRSSKSVVSSVAVPSSLNAAATASAVLPCSFRASTGPRRDSSPALERSLSRACADRATRFAPEAGPRPRERVRRPAVKRPGVWRLAGFARWTEDIANRSRGPLGSR